MTATVTAAPLATAQQGGSQKPLPLSHSRL
jgi:hypothetical protein